MFNNNIFAVAVEHIGRLVFHLTAIFLYLEIIVLCPGLWQLQEELASHRTSAASSPQLLSLEGSKQSAHKPTSSRFRFHRTGQEMPLLLLLSGTFKSSSPAPEIL